MRTETVAVRWALVTFAGMIAAAVLAHYLPTGMAAATVIALAIAFSVFGALGRDGDA